MPLKPDEDSRPIATTVRGAIGVLFFWAIVAGVIGWLTGAIDDDTIRAMLARF